jgi:chloramphenicol O-acetyltransferase type A
MYSIIDTKNWLRKEVYEFFREFEEPYFGITADVDVTNAYQYAKKNDLSFFILYLHKSLCAVNEIDALKLRIVDNQVLLYDVVHSSATINRENGSFGFSFITFDDDLNIFRQHAIKEIERIRMTTNLFPDINGKNCIHHSSLPWLKFTSLSHARSFKFGDSVPKISFGKMTSQNGRLIMPCSVHVHHGLADGKDVGKYFELFQRWLDIDQ